MARAISSPTYTDTGRLEGAWWADRAIALRPGVPGLFRKTIHVRLGNDTEAERYVIAGSHSLPGGPFRS